MKQVTIIRVYQSAGIFYRSICKGNPADIQQGILIVGATDINIVLLWTDSHARKHDTFYMETLSQICTQKVGVQSI